MESIDAALEWDRESRINPPRRPLAFVRAENTNASDVSSAATAAQAMTGSQAASAFANIVDPAGDGSSMVPFDANDDRLICSICRKLVVDLATHTTSLAHLLASKSEPLVVPRYYKVRGVGRDMLERAGWQAGAGLGARNQGRDAPLRASDKQDRRGIGAAKRKRTAADEERARAREPQLRLSGSAHVRRGKEYEHDKKRFQAVYGALSDLGSDPVL